MKQTTKEEDLQTCKLTRKIAADSLFSALSYLLKKKNVSEVDLRDKWLEEMNKNNFIFPEGWYSPPPKGICVLFGTDSDNKRLNYESLRPEEMWPRDDIFLNQKEGIIYVYASPVDKKTGIIGDFGMTIYFGKNKLIQKYLSICYGINKKIYEFIKVGMPFSEIYKFAEEIIKKHGLYNKITSITDPAATNIGHTIPPPSSSWEKNEQIIFESEQIKDIKKIVSSKRKFVSSIEKFKIQGDMSITIEPRPRVCNKPEIPMISYHNICVINKNERIELLTDFEKIFQLVGMDYMLE
jgi:hypothetical protein